MAVNFGMDVDTRVSPSIHLQVETLLEEFDEDSLGSCSSPSTLWQGGVSPD